MTAAFTTGFGLGFLVAARQRMLARARARSLGAEGGVEAGA